MTDVVIAGGGPCGLVLATELGRRGVPVLLVDPKPGTAFNPQANATQARTMEHFRRLGFAHEIRAQGLPADHPTDIAYFTRFARHELARLRLPTAAEAVRDIRTRSGSWAVAELPHRVAQKFVEQTLLRHARAFASNTIRHGWALDDFTDRGDHVDAVVRPVAGGAAETVRCRFLVGADGAKSLVRQRLGIAWEGETGVRRDFMGGRMLAVYLRAPTLRAALPHPRAWMNVTVNAERRTFMCPVDGRDEYAFHAALGDAEGERDWSADDARRVFAQAVGVELPIEVLSLGTWLAGHSLVARRFRADNVVLAGDAAHLFTPTGGLGYNTAVEDAINLAWKLAAVVRGTPPEPLLASYEAERLPLADRNTGHARRFADSIGRFRAAPELERDDAVGEAARATASAYLLDHAKREFDIPGVTLGGRYDGSTIVVGDGSAPPPDETNRYVPSAVPGGRPPHAWLDDGSSLFDTFHREWTLLALGPSPPSTSPFEEAAARLGVDLGVVRHGDATLAALYEAPLALIRPDHIVAWRGRPGGDAAAVLARASGHAASRR
jgi:2-polyprenyl-6-methoxyphenol hydroxylase-like FAD-dependent oxidoreductase